MRGRPAIYRVEHEGRTVSLKELSRMTGIRYRRLLWRFQAGMRGQSLVKVERHSTNGVRA